jgi:peptidoglycan hydrolase-like protein with peptidoglycan-binding domain
MFGAVVAPFLYFRRGPAAYRLLSSLVNQTRRLAVTKYRVIIPTCFLLASGCALLDHPELASETPTVSVAVIENEPLPPAPVVETADPKLFELPVPVRTLTKDNVRRLQAHLRDMGLDPGPIDGIAGARTKAAYIRLHTGCSKIGPLIENLHLPVAEAQGVSGNTTGYKLPNREETRNIQSQLRGAGFDPGPVDGIFGRRTKSMIRELQIGCLMANEFEGTLMDDSSLAANAGKTSIVPLPASLPVSGSQPSTAPASHDTPKAVAATMRSRSRDDIRILQLRLRDAGFDPGPFDGVMGPKTRSALEQYESSERGTKIKTGLTSTSIGGQY